LTQLYKSLQTKLYGIIHKMYNSIQNYTKCITLYKTLHNYTTLYKTIVQQTLHIFTKQTKLHTTLHNTTQPNAHTNLLQQLLQHFTLFDETLQKLYTTFTQPYKNCTYLQHVSTTIHNSTTLVSLAQNYTQL